MKTVKQSSKTMHCWLLASSCLCGLATNTAVAHAQAPASAADAQTSADVAPPAAPAPATPSVAEIIVTGSRIARPGVAAPTPVTSLTSDELVRQSPSTISDALRTLPALQNSTGTNRNTGSSGGGQTFLNLRSLGAPRTLVLLDGRRFVPSNVTGSVDANLIPSALIQRVDIVTGGASAAYGSDAVAGVVNFVLNTKFRGLAGHAQYGLTSEGDNKETVLSLSGGFGFAGGRGSLIASGEYYHNEGIDGNARGWANANYQVITNPAGNGTVGNPTQILARDVRLVTSYGGLILNGNGGTAAANAAFRGITFNPDGSPRAYNFGTYTTAGTQVGGDGVNNGNIQQINRPLDRKSIFMHADFEVNPSLKLFAEGSFAAVQSIYINGPNAHNSNSAQTAYITIQRDNAYLPASLRAQMLATGVTSLTMTRWDLEDGITRTDNRNYTARGVGGFNAKLGDWKLDGYVEWGQNYNANLIYNTNKIGNFALATDAVTNGAGQVVCRSTLTNPGNGCVPFNPFGVGAPSAAAEAYVNGISPAYTMTREQMASLNLSGSPFSTWAGQVSTAFGLEYRRETANVTSDALSLVSGYKLGNQQPWSGQYHTKEIYGETIIPLAKDMTLLHALDVNAAFRYIDYSTSGGVTTWKGGVTYSPVRDIRLRLTRSRDIRAPNLNELYTGGRQQVTTVRDPFNNNATVSNISVLQPGNPALTPEIANTLTYGVVLEPHWVRGLTLTVDYYNININSAIGTPATQFILDQCYAGVTSLCSAINRNAAGALTSFILRPVNYSQAKATGIDFEATYRLPMADWASWWKGNLALHALVNYVGENSTTLPGAAKLDTAGDIIDGNPHWRGQVAATYGLGRFNGTVTYRFIGGGVYDPTRNAAQLGLQHIDGIGYIDTQFSVGLPGLGKDSQVYLNIKNLFNTDPRIAPVPGNLSIGTNAALYDTYGRVFRFGVKFKY